MRLLLSLFLTSFIYSLILGFFAYVILKKRETPQRVVFVHQVIKKSKKKQLPKISKKSAPKSPKKIATNSKFSKGGEEDIKFDDRYEAELELSKDDILILKNCELADMNKELEEYCEDIEKGIHNGYSIIFTYRTQL